MDIREKIAKWLHKHFQLYSYEWEEANAEVKKKYLRDSDEILAIIKEAGWIDPEKCVMPGEFGTPKADQILQQWAEANGYVKLADLNK